MRVWLTGGTGFVGSNIVAAALARGDEVLTTVNTFRPPANAGYSVERVDMTDPGAVARSVSGFAPDLVVHCAILNDWDLIYADRSYAWDAYVTATESTISAAQTTGASHVLVSTDWVFDGTQPGADEETPPNPVNLYGVLKLASEMVARERGAAVARVSGVNGLHRARPNTPRVQDAGFGYFVASMVDALHRGERFIVWESDAINMVATPSLAIECGEIILDVGERRLDGVFHCCGADSVSRRELAELTCEVFGLDSSLLGYGAPPTEMMPKGTIPFDTSIVAPRTSELLRRTPTPVRQLIERFRSEYQGLA